MNEKSFGLMPMIFGVIAVVLLLTFMGGMISTSCEECEATVPDNIFIYDGTEEGYDIASLFPSGTSSLYVDFESNDIITTYDLMDYLLTIILVDEISPTPFFINGYSATGAAQLIFQNDIILINLYAE